MSVERWAVVPGTDGFMVSNRGRAWSPVSGRHVRGSVYHNSSNDGYRVFNFRGQRIPAHRAVLLTFVGDPPHPGDTGSHLNGYSLDNRVENLKWESLGDNIRRKTEHGTMVRGTEINTAKLTEDQVRDIRRRLVVGETKARLAREYGVSSTAICYIATRRNWGWLDD